VKQREDYGTERSADIECEHAQSAWGNKHRAPDEYLVARDGDHLLVPFECDLCIFRKLHMNDLSPTSEQDRLLLACYRHVTLDAFWSTASSTVAGNRDKIRQGLVLSKLVGLDGPYVHYGSMPSTDTFGYEVAIQTVLALRRPGKYARDHTQWDSIRKYHTAYANHVRASPQVKFNSLILGDDKGKAHRFVEDGCSSYWYSRFSCQVFYQNTEVKQYTLCRKLCRRQY
jgi:hypothetical protein